MGEAFDKSIDYVRSLAVAIDEATKACHDRLDELDAADLDSRDDPLANKLDATWNLAVLKYSRAVYDLLGPRDLEMCSTTKIKEAEKRLVFWANRTPGETGQSE